MTTQDIEAERALLGACLLSDTAIEASMPYVSGRDFTGIHHAAIFDTLVAIHQAGESVDLIALARRAAAPIDYLHELHNATYSTGLAAQYAALIAEARVRHRLVEASARIAALGNGLEPSKDAADAAEQARSILANIDMPTVQGLPDPDIDSWIEQVDTSYDWLIPEFLERGDRLLLTAAEGAGKSLLLAQIAFQAAAGIHPWSHRRINPIRVLIIDLENGDKLLARRFADLRSKVPDGFDPDMLRFHGRPRGIDITSITDRRWLTDRIAVNRPDLLVVGPAYKLTRGEAARTDLGGEERAKLTADALDDLRDRYGIALIMETHAPHGGNQGRDLRPFGSTVWLRWPEFGIGIAKSRDNPRRFELKHWRGPRDLRTWPQALEKGGRWPWTAVGMPDGSYGHELPPVDLYDDAHLFEETT